MPLSEAVARCITFVVVLGAAAPTAAFADDSAPPAETEPDEPARDPRKDEAREYFQRGVELFRQGAVEAALAEFLRSRELFPTKNATDNAAICLRKVGRFDEAIAMYDSLLGDFPDLPAELRAGAERARAEVRALIGSILLSGGERGAIVVVDGKERGTLPLAAPLRVPSGTHVVRVYKPGFVPFEAQVTVAGGSEQQLVARLLPLVRAGHVRVVEASGASVDVLVDGITVGKTPWEGALSLGAHAVALRGEGERGTQPIAMTVTSQKTQVVTLVAEELPCVLRIEVVPPHASVLFDGAPLPLGTWEGRVRAGEHRIEAFAVGHVDLQQRIELRSGAQRVLRVELERKPNEAPSEVVRGLFVEIAAAPAFAPTLGGDMASLCELSTCDASVVFGGNVWIRAGYRHRSGAEVGLSLGYIGAGQMLRDRLIPAGWTTNWTGPILVDDRLTLHGMAVGASVAYTTTTRFPVRGRIGFGVAPSWVGDQRTGSGSDPRVSHFVPAYDSSPALLGFIAPGLAVGVEIDPRLELMFGVDVLLLFALSRPAWDTRHDVAVQSGIVRFPSETLVGPVVSAVAPQISARYTFR